MVDKWLAAFAVGESLFDPAPATKTKKVRRLVVLLGVAHSDLFTFKSFGAGRATALLQAGEWRSAVFLRYRRPGELSVSVLLDVVLKDGEEHD